MLNLIMLKKNEILESRLDSGLKLEGVDSSELCSKIKLDFTKLSTSINSYQKQDITFFMELMTSHHRALLKHPLSEVNTSPIE